MLLSLFCPSRHSLNDVKAAERKVTVSDVASRSVSDNTDGTLSFHHPTIPLHKPPSLHQPPLFSISPLLPPSDSYARGRQRTGNSSEVLSVHGQR
ncbi:hypothetical protein EVAR_58220_1 [Eumeta japonica]|uniref:Uncharacterized protein n=1 Tax=Eumeta variegata TaxID=151549 RepID=A0A4C1ZNT5_EUMVA|nr:hypothetical protein EVAR_58220_1 [Eumeta japonica]